MCKCFLVTEAERKHVRQRPRFQQLRRDASCNQVFFLQGKAPKEIHAILKENLGKNAPLCATIKHWVAQFKHCDFSTRVAPRQRWLCPYAEFTSVFLLQRLKGSMSGDARDFNNIETRAVIQFFFLQGKTPKEIHAILKENLGKYAPLYATIKKWVAQFKHGDFSTCVAPRPGRPKTITTPEIFERIHEVIFQDRGISAKSIPEKLGISRERVGSSIMNIWKCESSP